MRGGALEVLDAAVGGGEVAVLGGELVLGGL